MLAGLLATATLIVVLTVSLTLTLVISGQDPMDKFNVKRDPHDPTFCFTPIPESRPVPRLLGLTEDQAVALAERWGYTVKKSYPLETRTAAERIVDQHPKYWSNTTWVSVEIADIESYGQYVQAQALAKEADDKAYYASHIGSHEDIRRIESLGENCSPGTHTGEDSQKYYVSPQEAMASSARLIEAARVIVAVSVDEMKGVVADFCDRLIAGDLVGAESLCSEGKASEIATALEGATAFEVTRTSCDTPDPTYYSFPFNSRQVDVEMAFAAEGSPLQGTHICRFGLSRDKSDAWRISSVEVAGGPKRVGM